MAGEASRGKAPQCQTPRALPVPWPRLQQRSGRSSTVLGTRGTRKDTGHKAMPPKPRHRGPLCQPAVSPASATRHGCVGTSHASCPRGVLCPFPSCSTPLPAPAVPPPPRARSPDPPAQPRWGEAPSAGCPSTLRATQQPPEQGVTGKPYAPARGAGADASPAADGGQRGIAGGGRGLLRMGVRYLAGCRGGGGGVQLTAARKEEREKRGGERQRAAAAAAPPRATEPGHSHNPPRHCRGTTPATGSHAQATTGMPPVRAEHAGPGSDPKATDIPSHPPPAAGAAQRGTTGLVARRRGTTPLCRAHGAERAAAHCPYVPVPVPRWAPAPLELQKR